MRNLERLHHKEPPSNKIQKIQFPFLHCCREMIGPEKIASMRAVPVVALINKNLKYHFATTETMELFKKISTFHLFPEENGKSPPFKMREVWIDFFLNHLTKPESALKPIICRNNLGAGKICYHVIRSFPFRLDNFFSEGREIFLLIIVETISKETNITQFKLTKREKEVIGLLIQGLDYNKVGQKLFVSTHTVQSHIKNIKRKLKVNCKLSLILKILGIEEKIA